MYDLFRSSVLLLFLILRQSFIFGFESLSSTFCNMALLCLEKKRVVIASTIAGLHGRQAGTSRVC
jgi:hypothetical protein